MMATRTKRRSRCLYPLLGGLALALLPLLVAQPLALSGLWLAQAAFAYAVGCAHDAHGDAPGLRQRAQGLGRIALLYALTYLGVAAVLAWPLQRFLAQPGVGSVLALSALGGLLLLALWSASHRFARACREGGSLRTVLSAPRTPVASDEARGLAIALLVLGIVLGGLLPAWPTPLLEPALRTPWLLAHALLTPLAHGLIGWLGAAPAERRNVVRTAAPVAAAVAVAAAPSEALAAPPAMDSDALYAALHAGELELALALIAGGVDVHALPHPDQRDQRTLPMLAAVLPDLRVLRALIEHGLDPDRSHAGLTPLLAATRDTWHGRADAVTMLLANGADARVGDADGNTPLHHAAHSSDPGVAALLIDAGASVDAIDHVGHSPLAAACAIGNWRLARMLLERGARCEPEGGQPVLLAAAGGEDDAAGVQLLLKHKARVNACDGGGRSALLVACHAGNRDIADALVRAGADRNVHDHNGATPLLEAASGGFLEVLRVLAGHPSPDASVTDQHGRNALALACLSSSNDPALVEQLLAMGVDPDLRDHDGRRPIDHAMANGRWRLVAALEPEQPLPSSIAAASENGLDEQRTPLELLQQALRERDFGLAHSLYELAAADAAMCDALLLELIDDADPALVQWLLAHGAQADRAHAGTDSVLFHLLGRGEGGMGGLRRVLDAGCPAAGAGALVRYLDACLGGVDDPDGAEQLAQELLARGADPFAPARDGAGALHLAVTLDWPSLAAALLARGADPGARDGRGVTVLQAACVVGSEPLVRLLVRHGADVAARAADGQTALGIALNGGRHDLARWLDWPHWALPGRALRDSDLPAAAMAGDLDATERLLALGLPLNARDAQGCTALLRAAGGGHRNIVERLLGLGADSTLAAHTGATPLSAAVSMRQAEIVERLLAGGAPVDQPLPGGVTPLMVACALGLNDLVARLLARRANVGTLDDQGHAPLHYAAQFVFQCRDRQRALVLLDTLLLSSADPDVASDSGHTPLLLLLGARADTGATCDEGVLLASLDRLLREPVGLSTQEGRGFAPLHLAALHGLGQVVRRLLSAGADPRQRDGLNRTPQEVAVLRGFVDVAAEFEPARAGASMARFLRKPDPL